MNIYSGLNLFSCGYIRQNRRIRTLLSLCITRHWVCTVPSFPTTSLSTSPAPYLCSPAFLISTLQSCTPAAALFSPHCTLSIMSPQHTLRRNNFVTTSLHLLPLQGIQAKVTCLKWCYSWGTRAINFLFKIIKNFHIKILDIQYQLCNH